MSALRAAGRICLCSLETACEATCAPKVSEERSEAQAPCCPLPAKHHSNGKR